MIKKLAYNPYLIFLPFFCYYIYTIIKNKWPSLYGDEIRYVDQARHLVKGYYSPYPLHINLWNGPGYPLLLAPFIALHIHGIYITLMNAVYIYLALIFLYKALNLVANYKTALLFSLPLAVYPNMLSILPIMYTEALTYFLVSVLIFLIATYYVKCKPGYLIAVGLVLGYLTLTKIIFGYVLIIGIIVFLIILLFKRNRKYCRASAKILLIAFVVTTPYLAYTYYITGKVLYWGNSGGMSLYWMSTPYPQEYGDWKVPELTNKQYPTLYKSAEATAILKKNHANEINYILKHNELRQDELFKQVAITNIKRHPLKFARNYYYNVARMLFNFPYSYAYQDASIISNIITGSLILWASVIGLILTVFNWRIIIFPVKLILFLTGVYLLLSGAVSAYPRQLDVMLPALLFWIGYLFANRKKFILIPKPQWNVRAV